MAMLFWHMGWGQKRDHLECTQQICTENFSLGRHFYIVELRSALIGEN